MSSNLNQLEQDILLFLRYNYGHVLRNHLTLRTKNHEKIIQNMKVMYKNQSEKKINVVLLAPRRKKLQRNMKVYDRKGDRLMIVPSSEVHKALKNIFEDLSLKIEKKLKINISKDISACSDRLFRYSHETEGSFSTEMKKIERIKKKIECSKDKKSRKYMTLIYQLCKIYTGFYIPIIALSTPLKKGESILIEYEIEKIRPFDSFVSENDNKMEERGNEKSTLDHIVEYFFKTKLPADYFTKATIPFSFPLELEKKASNHINIIAPEGLVFEDFKFCEIETTYLKWMLDHKREYMDKELIHLYFPVEESIQIWETQKDKKELESNNKPHLEVKVGIEQRSVILSMTKLMYILAVLHPILAFFHKAPVNYQYMISSLGAILVLMVALGVYSIDKDFLHEYIKVHIQIVVLLFLIFEVLALTLNLFF